MHRYLVIQLARFGDLLQSKRLILSLLARQDGEVHLLCDKSLLTLAKLVYPQVYVHGLTAHGICSQDVSQLISVVHELLKLDFELIFNLNYSELNFVLAGMFKTDKVRGYHVWQGQSLKSSWGEQAFRWSSKRRIKSMNLMDFWAGHICSKISPQEVNPQAEAGGKGLGIVLAGQNQRRSLPVKLLANLAGAALHRIGHGPVYLLGSKAEIKLARQFLLACNSSLRNQCQDLTGKTDWKGLIDSLEGLDLVLSPDTGTMHLAAHLGVPVWAFFLSSAFCYETGPYGLGHKVVQATASCAPCVESQPCPWEQACLKPFMSPEMLKVMAGGKSYALPEGIQLLSSYLDEAGVWFKGIEQKDIPARECFLREIGFIFSGNTDKLCPQPGLDMLERDWMLPRHSKYQEKFYFAG